MTPLAKPPSLPSLLAKLRNRARQDSLPVDLMLLLYFYEGFLARLAVSAFKDKLILKGGFNLYGRYQHQAQRFLRPLLHRPSRIFTGGRVATSLQTHFRGSRYAPREAGGF